MADESGERGWRVLIAECKAWAIFLSLLILFSILAGQAIAGALTDIPVDDDLPAAAASAFFFWQGLLLFAVIRYGRLDFGSARPVEQPTATPPVQPGIAATTERTGEWENWTPAETERETTAP